MKKCLINTVLWFLTILVISPGTLAQAQAALRGQVRSEVDDRPIGRAEVVAVDATDPMRQETVESNVLGFFQFTEFEAGDSVEITVTHPTYLPEEVEFNITAQQPFLSIELEPILINGVPATPFDISVQMVDAVTLLPLKSVPVELRRYEAMTGGAAANTFNLVTDAKGVAQLVGALPGFYEFEINPTDHPGRKPKYEAWPTAPQPRVSVTKEHITSVFLKPELQDLRVRVTGYDFKTKEAEQPLKEVLVEVRGLDPDDLDKEILHARNDYTVFIQSSGGGGGSVDPNLVVNRTGECIFTGLPPAAYEVRVYRLGYVPHVQIIQPDEDGQLPFGDGNPLEVELEEEQHFVDVKVELPEFFKRSTFDPDTGFITSQGVDGIGLSVKLVGISNSNTDGLEYVTSTGVSLSGESLALFFDKMLAGRYQIFVDGLSKEQVREIDGFDSTDLSQEYEMRIFGEGVVEILPTESTAPSFTLGTVSGKVPRVTVRGQLKAADTLEKTSKLPVFTPLAEQEIIIETIENDDHRLDGGEAVTVTTDADGYFSAELLPGAYGIRVPGLSQYFGDEVIHVTTASPDETLIGARTVYKWPLVDAYPDLPSGGTDFSNAFFGKLGIPIHGGREQFLELRLRRELYEIGLAGVENSQLGDRVIVMNSEGPQFSASYRHTLATQAQISISSSSQGPLSAVIRPNDEGFAPLRVDWHALPPGVYGAPSASVAGFAFETTATEQTFLDFPEPGTAPTNVFALNFRSGSLPSGKVPVPPLNQVTVGGESFVFSLSNDHDEDPISILVWNPNAAPPAYEEAGTLTFGSMVEVNFASGYYTSSTLSPGGPVTAVWTTNTNDQGDEYPVRLTPGSTLFVKGPTPTPKTDYPSLTYSHEVTGVAAEDENKAISASMVVAASNETFTTPTTLVGQTVSPTLTKGTGDNFILTDGLTTYEGTAGSGRLVTRLKFAQGMEVGVTVMDNRLQIPLEGIVVILSNRYGRELSRLTTDENGGAVFNGLTFQDYFVDIQVPGYIPFRQALRTSAAQPGGNESTALMHAVSANLVLLTKPSLITEGIPLDRFGLFLPGVTRSGDVDIEANLNNYSFFKAADALKATWALELVPTQISYPLPQYDDANGQPQDDKTIVFTDKIKTAYFLDSRRFAQDGFKGGLDLGDPEDPDSGYRIPFDDSPINMKQFLMKWTNVTIETNGPFKNTLQQRRVFMDLADTVEKREEDGVTVAQGDFQLWDLPFGKLSPSIIVETESGAYLRYDAPYGGSDDVKQLNGIELPSWLSSLLDIFGIASGLSTTQERLMGILPNGRYIPLPEFSAKIEAAEEEDESGSFLNYEYSLAIANEMGQEGKAAGLLSLAPGLLGATAKGEMKLTATGKMHSFNLTVNGNVTTDKIIQEPWAPKIKGASVATFPPESIKASGGFSTTISKSITPESPFEFQVTNSTGVTASFDLETKLNQYATPIPYVGPLIGLLGDTKAAVFTLNTGATAAIAETYQWTTQRPSSFKAESRERDEHVELRHALGGRELMTDHTLCLGVGFSAGLGLKVLGGTGTARADVSVGGNGCGVSEDFSTMEFDLNANGTWPLVREIRGQVAAKAKVAADFGFLTTKKEWEFTLAEFKVQFGTETVVQHVAVESAFVSGGTLLDFAPSFKNKGPALITDFTSSASYGFSGVLANRSFFVRAAESGESMDLVEAPRVSLGLYGTPEAIFTDDYILKATTLELSDGRVLYAYASPAAGADLYDPFALSELRYVIRAANGSLSDPTTLATMAGTPQALKLAESGDLICLVCEIAVPTESGAEGVLVCTSFDGNAWSSASEVAREDSISSFDLMGGGAGAASEAVVMWVNEAGTLKARALTSTGPGMGPYQVATNMRGAVGGYATPFFYQFVAASESGEIRRYFAFPPLSQNFQLDQVLATGRTVNEIAMTQQSVDANGGYLTTWTEPSPGGSRLYYMHLGTNGTPVAAPAVVSQNRRGLYHDMMLARQNNVSCLLYSRFTNGNHEELRFFSVTVGDGISPNDSDEDTLPDTEELRIVDADPDDNIRSVEDVIGSDDFDLDNFDNASEIAMDTDPTDPLSFPQDPDPGTEPGVIAFGAALISVGEDVGTAQIPVLRTSGSAGTVSVTVDSSAGTASEADFTTVNHLSVTFTEGETQKFVPVNITSDPALKEANETFTLTLSSPVGGATLGTLSSTTVRIVDAFDKSKPSLTLLTPKNKEVIPESSGSTVNVTGTAKDNLGIERVEIALDGGSFQSAVLTHAADFKSCTYALPVMLSPGPHELQVRAVDTAGLVSSTIKRPFTFDVERLLTVTVEGPTNSGTVSSGFVPDSARQVGFPYTIKATPKPSFVFNGWGVNDLTGTGIGGTEAEHPQLTFTMQEGLALTANFISNPFTPDISGTFSGLILPDEGTPPGVDTVGLFNMTLTSKGSFSGSLLIDGTKLGIKGVLNNEGESRFGKTFSPTLQLPRKGKSDLAVSFNLDVPGASGKIMGSVSQVTPEETVTATSTISANRSHYGKKNPVSTELAGNKSQRYNLILPAQSQTPALAANLYPQGTGIGSMIIKPDGKVSFVLLLPDNTKLSVGSTLSSDNDCPLFGQLYSKKGSLATLVKIDLDASSTDASTQDHYWFRPMQSKSPWYPEGWPQGLSFDLIGSRFQIPETGSIFPGLEGEDTEGGNAELRFTLGLLSEELLKFVNITPSNSIKNAPTTDKTFSIGLSKTTGEFKGTFNHTQGQKATWQATTFQKIGTYQGGHGFFLSPKPTQGQGESGRVSVQPQ